MPNEQNGIPISIKSSDKDILTSGTVHTFGLNNLEIQLSDLKFIIEFVNDASGMRIENSAGNKELRLQLFNFNNSLGSGITIPQKVGSYLNRELYFIFTTYAMNNNSAKLFHYTFFLGGPI